MRSSVETPIDLRSADAQTVRGEIRAGRYVRHTAGLAGDRLQCNLAIMPEAYALDFLRFCQRNPKPCPLVGVSETGDPMLRTLGRDIDVRSDVPRYQVYRDGGPAEELFDIGGLWRDDMVTFALGCSFTFERALAADGIAMRHIEQDTTVPMYRTSIDCVPAGLFSGKMVVSMRPIRAEDVERAVRISTRYPLAHGAPVHVGRPEEIGIIDVAYPDWGDPVRIREGELPVFWACGVTPQSALVNARLPLCITHAPGHMLITDIDDTAEVPVLQYQPKQERWETTT